MYALLSRNHVKMVLIQTDLPMNIYIYFGNVFIACMGFSTLSGGSYNSPNFSRDAGVVRTPPSPFCVIYPQQTSLKVGPVLA